MAEKQPPAPHSPSPAVQVQPAGPAAGGHSHHQAASGPASPHSPSPVLQQGDGTSSARAAAITPPPMATTTATSSGEPSPRSSGKHAFYRGIRCRSGKWVSEIREPRKARRIWLGTYPMAEMAAAAYDVAARALRGADAVLNFPGAIASRAAPASASPEDIRAAAAAAAAAAQLEYSHQGRTANPPPPPASPPSPAAAAAQDWHQQHDAAASYTPQQEAGTDEFMDEEAIFEMPQLLRNMAAGMMMSPPRLSPDTSDESPDPSEAGESLWSYRDP
jgi:hypothetical protein